MRPVKFLHAVTRLAVRALVVHAGARWVRIRTRAFANPPTTPNEKIRHHMVFHRHQSLTLFADKVAVREFVADRVGDRHLTELFGVYDSADEIRGVDQVPRRCAIKATHGSGATILIDDETPRGGAIPRPRPVFPWNSNTRLHPDDVDLGHLRRLLDAWLRSDYSRPKAEWAYREVPRRILVEELLGGGGEPPPDFKFWCVNGAVRFFQVDRGRFGHHTRSIHLPDGTRLSAEIQYPAPDEAWVPPVNLDEMIELASELSSGVDFIRVDLYTLPKRVVVGELTNYPEGGMGRMRPAAVFTDLLKAWNPV